MRRLAVSLLGPSLLFAGLLGTPSSVAQCVRTADVTGYIQYPNPAPAYDSLLVYDTARSRVLALEECFGVVYVYDGHSWVHPLPPPHQDLPPCSSRGAWVYDGARAVALLLTGLVGTQPSSGLYSYDTQAWKALTWSGPSPPPAYAAVGAYDPARSVVIFLIRSDSNSPYSWQVWEWTGSGWNQGPNLENADPDSFTFDTGRGVGFLSGKDPASGLEAVWLFAPGPTAAAGSWSQVTLSGDPYSARIGAPLAFDPIRDRVIRCMGKDPAVLYGYSSQIDVWDWAQSRWKHTDYADDLPDPDRRAGAGAVFDPNRDVLVLYGGIKLETVNGTGTTTYWTDTWEQQILDVLYVNGANSGTQDGSAANPYRTVRQAVNGITGCIRAISVQSGDYSESPLTLSTAVRIEARGGTVTIR